RVDPPSGSLTKRSIRYPQGTDAPAYRERSGENFPSEMVGNHRNHSADPGLDRHPSGHFRNHSPLSWIFKLKCSYGLILKTDALKTWTTSEPGIRNKKVRSTIFVKETL